MTLAHLIERARSVYGSYQAIADATGVSLSALCRSRSRQQVLGTDALIALAEVIGEAPDVVLRAAGKGETADRLARLYGCRPVRPLSALDRRVLALPAATKRGLLALRR